MLNKFFKILIIFFALIMFSGLILFYTTKTSNNLNYNFNRVYYSEEQFIRFLEDEIKTEKMHLKFSNQEDFYFIDYYVSPVFFIPFKKIKIDKNFIDVLFQDKNHKYSLNIQYTCLGLLSFNNKKPKNRDINKYFDLKIINYKNKNINLEHLKKRCI